MECYTKPVLKPFVTVDTTLCTFALDKGLRQTPEKNNFMSLGHWDSRLYAAANCRCPCQCPCQCTCTCLCRCTCKCECQCECPCGRYA